MLRRIALGVPRFSMTKPRLSFSTRRKSWPKFDRACSAEITMPLFLADFVVGIKSPVCPIELYSLRRPSVNPATMPDGIGALSVTGFRPNEHLFWHLPNLAL